MNRRDTILALLALGAAPAASLAQQAGKMWRVGFLVPKTAKAIGIAFSPALLLRADHVID